MIDVWRTLHPRTNDYTYYSNRHSTYNSLDYFLMFNKDIAAIKKMHYWTNDTFRPCNGYSNRFLSDNIRRTLNIIDYSQKQW